MFINVFQSDLYKRSNYGITYPYIFPENKEISDKIPTITIDNFDRDRRRSVSLLLARPDPQFSNTTTWVKNRHTFKGGIVVEYSGEDDFDQINVQPIPGSTNNQNGRFEFRNSTTARTGLGIADAAMGLFTNYAEIGQRALTKWRATATDFFVQDSWRPPSNLTIEGGVRYVLWPPWSRRPTTSPRSIPAYYDTSEPGGDRSDDRRDHRRPALQRHPPPGRRLPDRGERPGGLQRSGRARAVHGRAARPHQDPQERLRAARRRVLRAERQDRLQGERRRLPQPRHAERLAAARRQPAVPAAGQRQQRLGRQPGRRRRRGGAAARHDRIDPVFKHPGGLHVFGGRAARDAARLRRRCRPTSAGRAATCSASATSTSSPPARSRRIPGINSAACVRTRATASSACRRTPATRSTTRCSSASTAATATASSSALPTRSATRGQRQRQARRAVQHLRRLGLLGQLQLRPPPRVQLLLHLRPAVLHASRRLLGGRWVAGRSPARRSCAPAPRSG